ncbi:MAG TPA: SDR family oxidoreductase [Gemmatimonadales bacterium]|nr:SDR family oxidoreductase [Gemmatimonadales bacterium]
MATKKGHGAGGRKGPGRPKGESRRYGEPGGRGGRDMTYARAGERAAEGHRALQREAEAKRAKAGGTKPKGQGAVQPPTRRYPAPPLPEQRLPKPGLESELEPRPAYTARGYRGSGKLRDRVALVTGADSGIGRAVAVLYAREGADVAIVYLDEHHDAEETRAAVEAEGRRALLIPGDVTDPAFCRHAVERAVEELGRLDILVNNAAFQEHAESLEDISDEQWDRTFRTNIYGYFYMARAALRHLRSGGVILNCGSVTGLQGSKQLLDYSATKGAIHAFTKSLAQNLVEKGIRVNAVAPGPVWTPLNPADQEPAQVAQFGADVPMKRPAQPEEIAPAFVFLASPVDSSYITGEVLPVLGGETVGA